MKSGKYLAASALLAFSFATPALAQTPYPGYQAYPAYQAPVQSFCPQLSYNLYSGTSDYYTAGQVSQLQQFLAARGYYQPVTGYYGSITAGNVAQFQQAQGVYPVTGGVGPLTRAAIARLCSGITVPPYTSGVSITNVSGPTSLAAGSSGTWSITTNAQYNTYLSVSVRWGDEYAYPYASSPQAAASISQQNTFSHTYYQAGTYTITFTVTDGAGRTTSANATVVVGGGNTGCAGYWCTTAPSVTSITPASGSTGTVVSVYGSGFTSSNTVHFGIGGKMSVPSYNNGTLLYFTIPSTVSNCDVIMTFAVCTNPIEQVGPGSYQLYVTNTNGQSAAQTFTVTGASGCGYANCQAGITITSPSAGQTYTRGGQMPITWSGSSDGYASASTVLDLYSVQSGKVGTVAIQTGASGSYTWNIPQYSADLACTMQYPNGLCGTDLPNGQYYLKATLVQGTGFDNGAQIATANSGTFSIGGGSTSSSITAYPQSGYAPLMVTFSVGNYSGYYSVSFGDGTSATMQSGSVAHTYYNRGTFTAQFSSDYQCLHSTPACAIAVQNLGSTVVTVY